MFRVLRSEHVSSGLARGSGYAVGLAALSLSLNSGAQGRDYSLHMLVHVAPQCGLSKPTHKITLYSMPNAVQGMRRGQGRVHVVCNTAFAVGLGHYKTNAKSGLSRIVKTSDAAVRDNRVRVAFNAAAGSEFGALFSSAMVSGSPSFDAGLSIVSWNGHALPLREPLPSQGKDQSGSESDALAVEVMPQV